MVKGMHPVKLPAFDASFVRNLFQMWNKYNDFNAWTTACNVPMRGINCPYDKAGSGRACLNIMFESGQSKPRGER